MDLLSSIKGLVEFIPPFLEGASAVRAILGFILVFFLPGFAWTLVFFRQINIIERLVFSLALSIVIVTLSLLLANLMFGLRLTALNSVLVIGVLTLLPLAIYYLGRLAKRRNQNAA